MSSPFVAAAWHARMTHSDAADGLCVAVGEPERILSTSKHSEVADLIGLAHDLSKAGFYLVGGLTYEAAAAFDPALSVCSSPDLPLIEFHVFKQQQVSIRPLEQIKAMPQDAIFSPWQDIQTSCAYENSFSQVRQAIEAGEFYQINLTTRLKARCEHQDSWLLFQHLYLAQTAPQSVFLKGSVFEVISLSPELFFEWNGTELLTAPMKGTRRPGAGGFARLSDSEKDRAENVMIVDLLRNDMAKVCKQRSVQVRSLFDVMQLPTVEQMTSSICGQTRSDIGLADIFSALFPCGSVTGAPKSQAMLRIAQLERAPRKFYCGAFGVLSPGGAAHFNVPIRTVIAQNEMIEYGVGSGITWYSTLQDEKKEWWQKTTFLRQATCDFQILETLRLDQGQWAGLEEHVERMGVSANHFSFAFDRKNIYCTLQAFARATPQGVFRVRCLLHADGELNVELQPFEPSPTSVQVRLANSSIKAPPEFILHKTTHRPEYDRFQNQAQGAFDVLLFNEEGDLTETCRCNVVLQINGELLTPQISGTSNAYLLPGVLRARLLRENTIRQARLKVQDLQRAEQIWLVNSLRGWLPVSEVLDDKGKPVFYKNQ